jgi:hypothetical protein
MNFVLACLQSPGNFRDVAFVIALSRTIAIANLAHFFDQVELSVLSLPGFIGRSSSHRPWLPDRPMKPGNDTKRLM